MAQAEWHYLIGPQLHGPATPEALRALFSAGEISHETLIRRRGAVIWKLFGDVFLGLPPGAAPAPEATLPVTAAAIFPPHVAASVMAAYGWSGAGSHPWRRYLAKMFGTILGRGGLS